MYCYIILVLFIISILYISVILKYGTSLFEGKTCKESFYFYYLR